MGFAWQFYLDDLEVEEPLGFSDLELSIERDPKLHGMTFEASLSQLKFYGAAADYLIEAKAVNGIRANVIFEAFAACDGYDYESVFRGRLNFGKFKKQCGDTCSVTIPVEEESCQVILKSRWDQKVDLDKSSAADGFTVLAPYSGLGQTFELPAREIKASIEAAVVSSGHAISFEAGVFTVFSRFLVMRPLYGVKTYDSIATGNIDFATDYGASPGSLSIPAVVSPQLLFEDSIACFNEPFTYSFRMKGDLNMVDVTGSPTLVAVRLIVYRGVWPDEVAEVDSTALPTSKVQSFDETFTGTITLAEGEGLYCLLEVEISGIAQTIQVDVTFDPESNVDITAEKLCPTTETEGYLVHETLSRVAESITNNCMRVKSTLYGRTDSQPFDFATDGCGGPRILTSGLKVRNAPVDKFFASMKDLIDGLNAIDNIGVGVEPDTMNRYLLRVETVDYFYQDVEIFRAPAIPSVSEDVIESEHYSKILVGYDKWEVERVNGLDEINSTREYFTALDTVSNTLDIKSKLVTGSYAIETTRQQSFIDTGAADTRYDNEIFLITLYRGGYLYSELLVEQGNIINDSNIFSPLTLYNYRLSPVRNLMRWYRSIASGFPSIAGTQARISFSAGTGNITASGEQSSGFCKIENGVVSESANVLPSMFAVEPTPLWRPESVLFEYPMSLADYRFIKTNPYGYVSYQCGTGEFLKGWVREIKYRQNDGMATINLKKQW